MSQYYLFQDTRKCIGCRACEVQCKANKNLKNWSPPLPDRGDRSAHGGRAAPRRLHFHAMFPL